MVSLIPYPSEDEKNLRSRLGEDTYFFLGSDLRSLLIDALKLISISKNPEPSSIVINNYALLLVPLSCVLEGFLFKIAEVLKLEYAEKNTIGQVFALDVNKKIITDNKLTKPAQEQFDTLVSFIGTYRNQPIHNVAKLKSISLGQLTGKMESMLEKVQTLVETLIQAGVIDLKKGRLPIGIREWDE